MAYKFEITFARWYWTHFSGSKLRKRKDNVGTYTCIRCDFHSELVVATLNSHPDICIWYQNKDDNISLPTSTILGTTIGKKLKL